MTPALRHDESVDSAAFERYWQPGSLVVWDGARARLERDHHVVRVKLQRDRRAVDVLEVKLVDVHSENAELGIVQPAGTYTMMPRYSLVPRPIGASGVVKSQASSGYSLRFVSAGRVIRSELVPCPTIWLSSA